MGQDGQAGEALDGVGVPDGQPQEEAADGSQSQDPLYVQKRLKQQKRAHEREIRELHQRINDMQSMGNAQQQQQQPAMQNPYANQMGMQQQAPQMGGMDEQIRQVVSATLAHKEMEERRAREAESKQHLLKQYDNLQQHLDKTADKYDDFDDVVRGNNSPFTPHMRDAALMLPKVGAGSAGEVFYKLGKNPEELSRIARLHPIDQASEMVKLSHALVNDGEAKNSLSRPLGNIKSNPVMNSVGITEKTSPSDIRARMKAGKFK